MWAEAVVIKRNYPTPMHALFEVEPLEPFKIIGSQCIDDFWISVEGRLQHAGNPGLACCRSDLELAINSGIVKYPRLSEKQVAIMKALLTLGVKWLFRFSDDHPLQFLEDRPRLAHDGKLIAGFGRRLELFGDAVLAMYDVSGIPCGIAVSIVQILRNNGVEAD